MTTAAGFSFTKGETMTETDQTEIIRVETEDELDAAIERICVAAGDLTVIRAGDGLHYLPWETEYGETWAIRPCTEDEYDRVKSGYQSVTVHLEDVPLPWTLVTAASEVSRG